MPSAPCAVSDGALPSSIALSVRVAPSRRLRLALGLAAAVHASASTAVLLAAGPFTHPAFIAAAGGAIACLLAGAAVQPLKTRRIDISGLGQIRLTVQQRLPDKAMDVCLLPGSALWPRLLLLRLASGDGAVHTVAVLPDSLEREQFRALSVALRAIANRSAEKNAMQKYFHQP